ncbi:MAG: hypothetical protein ACREDE_11580 [Thermoplasmata archaeon]
MSGFAYVGFGIALVVAIVVLVFYLREWQRNRVLGTPGIRSRSRLTCPHCNQTFEYDYIPGVSFTAVRLGFGRYMACPHCGRWSTFNLASTRIPAGPPQAP